MKQKFLLFALAVSMIFTACSSDDDPIVITSPVTISFEMPLNLENVEVQSSVVTLTNTATGIHTTLQNAIQHIAGVYSLNVEGLTEGTYRLKASGVLTYTVNGETYPTPFEIEQDNIALSLSKTSARITISTYTAKGGFVLSEIFFTGTMTAEGKQYTNDQYVVITNNSTETLYADGLALLESSFLSTNNYQYVPDTNNDVFAVGAVYVIPGNGQDHPVEPGKSITIAVNAINHTEANPQSFDLSDADFECFDETSNPNFVDVDNENVPNMDKWFCYTATLWSMHNRGFKAFALAKMQVSKEEWLENYKYEGKYIMTFNDTSYEMNVTNTYRVPMTWIIDGVNLSVESDWQWNILPANIDKSWTYCGKLFNDKTRYGKAVIRKQAADGRLQDTNDSANDFTAEATASRLN